MRDFNHRDSTLTPADAQFRPKNPPSVLHMTGSRIELGYSKVARTSDASDLAELLFPGNRNQQYAFLVIWAALKWAPDGIVTDLARVVHEHGITNRVYERVRAKMRRLGLIDRVSRFNLRYGRREGWMLSTRFERSLTQLAEKTASFRSTANAGRDKDRILISLAAARRAAVKQERHEMNGGGT